MNFSYTVKQLNDDKLYVFIDDNTGQRIILCKEEILGQMASVLYATELQFIYMKEKCSWYSCENPVFDVGETSRCIDHRYADRDD